MGAVEFFVPSVVVWTAGGVGGGRGREAVMCRKLHEDVRPPEMS